MLRAITELSPIFLQECLTLNDNCHRYSPKLTAKPCANALLKQGSAQPRAMIRLRIFPRLPRAFASLSNIITIIRLPFGRKAPPLFGAVVL